MKRLIIATALIAAGASSALAQTASQNITINATVDGSCSVTSPVGSSTYTIANSSGGLNAAYSEALGILCNKATTATLTSLNSGSQLTPVVAAPPGFANIIDYTATVTEPIGPTSVSLNTAGPTTISGPTALTSAAFSGNVTIGISPNPLPPATTLLAGSYSDTLTVAINPAP